MQLSKAAGSADCRPSRPHKSPEQENESAGIEEPALSGQQNQQADMLADLLLYATASRRTRPYSPPLRIRSASLWSCLTRSREMSSSSPSSARVAGSRSSRP